MSFDRYQTNDEFVNFDKYYDLFLKNKMERKEYTVILNDDSAAKGIPVAHSIVDTTNPKFEFYSNKKKYDIPYNQIKCIVE